jgi:hypothetical protein
MENEDLMSRAILTMRTKFYPQLAPQSSVSTPPEPHKQLFSILEVYDREREDPDIDGKTRFIYEFLTDETMEASDRIVEIMKELPTISTEPMIERIYKYCKLREEHKKAIAKAEILTQRMKQI